MRDQWHSKGTYLRPRTTLFLHSHQQKRQSLKWKIGAKACNRQKHYICSLLLLFIF